MLKAVMKKLDRIQTQMSNIKREIGILRKEQKEMLEVKSNITAMENIRKS